MNFNAKSYIDYGLPISKNFILEHLTSGAMHPSLGQIIPFKPANIFVKEFQNIPLHEIVNNLSLTSQNVLEPLLKEFGGLLNVQQGFTSIINGANEVLHKFGGGLDISVKGFEGDMSSIAKDIQSIARKASSINLVYDVSSHIHLDVDPDYLKKIGTSTRIELPTIKSIDTFSNKTVDGVFSLRSF